MVWDGHKVWADRMEGLMLGRLQRYILLTLSADTKQAKSNDNTDLKIKQKNLIQQFIKNQNN